MQDRTFDIAGPNPTPEEQKKIDEQYTVYLERERRNHIAAALAAKQKQQEQPQAQQGQDVQQVSLRSEQGTPQGSPLGETEKVPVPVASPVKQAARIKAAQCAKNQFSCEWPRLSESINELKRLLNPQQQQQQAAAKQKKS
jgi:Tfp pilus assembly protein PilE